MRTVLIIDDQSAVRDALSLLLSLHDIRPLTATMPDEGLALLARERVDVVIADMNFSADTTSGEEGVALFHAIRARHPDLPVILLTGWSHLETAVQLVKAGAADYMSKPWDDAKLLATVENLLELSENARVAETARVSRRRRRAALERDYDLRGIVFASDEMLRVLELACQVARAEVPVVITGPNGAGKERVAEIVHANSAIRDKPLVTVNCGALPSELIEAELFGAEAGAFTGATRAREGRFEAADGGTLFLDEIGNLPLRLQPKLLTVLEQRQVTPVGANKPVPVDIRVIAATNLPPEKLRDESHFRQDLLFRLNTVEIDLPPLRARHEDLPQLVAHYLQHYAKRYGRPVPVLSPAARMALLEHDWPGNVRALRHALERAVILAREEALEPEDFALIRAMPRFPSVAITPPPQLQQNDDLNLDRMERRIVEEALKKHGYNISLSAAELGLSRAALYRRMEKHGL